MNRVINLFAGPGTGKSTTCAALFAELKYLGHNTEMITEYAKDATWENRGSKLFNAQEYIFGKQSFRLSRVASEVDFVVTDSPLLMSNVYQPDDFAMPSLKEVVYEAHQQYQNLNIFLVRSQDKTYNPKGRNQTEDQARIIDKKIYRELVDRNVPFFSLEFSRSNVGAIINLMRNANWIA